MYIILHTVCEIDLLTVSYLGYWRGCKGYQRHYDLTYDIDFCRPNRTRENVCCTLCIEFWVVHTIYCIVVKWLSQRILQFTHHVGQISFNLSVWWCVYYNTDLNRCRVTYSRSSTVSSLSLILQHFLNFSKSICHSDRFMCGSE